MDSKNFITQDGKIKLTPGKLLIGNRGGAGKISGQIFGYKVDGTRVHWRKIGTKIQYLNGSTWTDVVTGLTADADYSFANYSSLAGTFTYAFGVDGIYKFHNAVPGSFNSMYNASVNFKGNAFIDKGRTILWGRTEDQTGLYGSHIDLQNSTVYTSVTGEATTSATGTLAFKAGGATRNCFAVQITLTGSGEVYTDNYDGTLTGSLGGTGTINYLTGAYTLSNTGVGTANYQWEDSNSNGVTDFTHSATRLASEGFLVPQDEGGTAILTVLIGPNGEYVSIKENTSYIFIMDSTDLLPSNDILRKNIGVKSLRGAYSSSLGIVFIDTSNPERPEMKLLEKNVLGDKLVPKLLFPHFDFGNYEYDDATIDSYEGFITVFCKTIGADNNDRLLLCDIENKTVDILSYSGRTLANDGTKTYMGSSVTEDVYELFTGFDDDTFDIDAYWIGKNEGWGSEDLKKYREIWLKGSISKNQGYQVFVDYDNAGFQLVGTILGTASYVDFSSPQSIGSNFIGSAQVGGDTLDNIFPYFTSIKLKKVPKFRVRRIKFVPTGIGYVDVSFQHDKEIDLYQAKIPRRFRQKQNVSLDGASTDLDNPDY